MYVTTDGKRLPTITKDAVKGFFGEYRFLSNFHLCKIEHDGMVFPSSENMYMSFKTLNKQVRAAFQHITPPQAKSLGRELVLRDDWHAVRYQSMETAIRAKFNQNPDLALLLCETDGLYLEETNNWGDTFWGVCDGIGMNHLGKILMKIRAEMIYGIPF